MIRIAAIMARGLGSRMRRTDVTASLDGLQASVADSGVKGMIPIAARGVGGTARPFLDYVISSLADVGITEVVIVLDRKSTRLNSSHHRLSRMPSSA